MDFGYDSDDMVDLIDIVLSSLESDFEEDNPDYNFPTMEDLCIMFFN